MRTEHSLTDWQKDRINKIKQQIEELEGELARIYLAAPIRIVTETEEEADELRRQLWTRYASMPPNLIQNVIADIRIKPYEKEERGDGSC